MKTAEAAKYEVKTRAYRVFPITWENLFRRRAPLVLEIGCGNGEFLAAWARWQPDWNFVGIELSLGSAERTLQRLLENGIENTRVIRDDARFGLREFFADESLQQVIMNYPDPWPKKKHRRRRLIIPDFIRTLSAVLQKNGIFELVTDQEWYAQEAAELFAENGCFRVPALERNPNRPVTTKYERKWREEGRDVFRLQVVKQKFGKIVRIVENGEMPHEIIRKEIAAGQVFALKHVVWKNKNTVFAIKEVFADVENTTFLLRTVTADGDYNQNFYILIAHHPAGFIVKIDPNIQPFRTPAVKTAIRVIADRLSASD